MKSSSPVCSPVCSSQGVSLWRGDSREIVATLGMKFRSIVTDPPYGAGLVTGDESPRESADLLGNVLGKCIPVLHPGSHVVFFWGSVGLDLAIESAKGAGLEYRRLLAMYLPQGNARPYLSWLPRIQPIVVMRTPGRSIPEWRQSFAAMLSDSMSQNGWSCTRLAKAIGCSPRLVTKWYRADDPAWSYPNPEHRMKLVEILGVELPEQPDENTCPFRHDLYQVQTGRPETSHPCEKPLSVVQDIVSRLDGPILDPFCGSGTTLVAAKHCGVEAVGIEIDPSHCEEAKDRLRQMAFSFSV